MKLFRKNQLVITALAALIAVAGYLNHVENTERKGALAGAKVSQNKESETREQESVNPVSSAAAEMMDIASNEIEMEGEPGEAVLVSASGTVDFIVEAKLAREEVRANSKQTLNEIINNQALTAEEKKAAVDRMVDLTEKAEREAEAETLIEAKGYENVVVSIHEDGVDVMVVAEELDGAARAQIEEIVKTKANVTADMITITAVKNVEK